MRSLVILGCLCAVDRTLKSSYHLINLFQVFGPVMPIVPVRDHNEAIDLINDRYDQLLPVLFCV